ncbi:MAG: transglycosylase SLT domain-containing protein [Bacteroidales bacterium]|nr:transglycosylase SLT domain-containing protein [Bacteroidales bacterium]NLK79802.1 transglycosylase SLT domain-containing protein [Bacteroidales bacterium]HKM31912.1 transglycosylase SLT domain-containing protein [Bacteroidales bacterium]HPX80203.1 transglycosylase SLT domain-containing protein [Bacteroidales bacterium]
MITKHKVIVVLAAVFLLAVLYVEFRNIPETNKAGIWKETDLIQLQGDTLRCTIYLPSYAGTRVGYHYEVMQHFSKTHGMALQYIPANDSLPVWDLLENHQTDILAINIIRDSIPKSLTGKLFITPQITSMGEVWVMLKGKNPWHLNLVHWLALFKQSPEYSRFRNRFIPAISERSPYDSLLMAQGSTLGWDWKLLRAVMYQESQYRMNAKSANCAIGLMQIKESTAVDMSIRDLYDPENNIRGAVTYFSFIKRNMHLTNLSKEEEINFVLAAYNAGMSRIEKGREHAALDGKDPNIWAQVSPYMPRQTQEYVEMIWFRYLEWVSAS